VDHHGQVIDVLLSAKRDLAAARRFFARALRAGTVPVEVRTDRAPVYPRVLGELVPSACTPLSGMRTTRLRRTTGG
jgi:transposase-like protein